MLSKTFQENNDNFSTYQSNFMGNALIEKLAAKEKTI